MNSKQPEKSQGGLSSFLKCCMKPTNKSPVYNSGQKPPRSIQKLEEQKEVYSTSPPSLTQTQLSQNFERNEINERIMNKLYGADSQPIKVITEELNDSRSIIEKSLRDIELAMDLDKGNRKSTKLFNKDSPIDDAILRSNQKRIDQFQSGMMSKMNESPDNNATSSIPSKKTSISGEYIFSSVPKEFQLSDQDNQMIQPSQNIAQNKNDINTDNKGQSDSGQKNKNSLRISQEEKSRLNSQKLISIQTNDDNEDDIDNDEMNERYQTDQNKIPSRPLLNQSSHTSSNQSLQHAYLDCQMSGHASPHSVQQITPKSLKEDNASKDHVSYSIHSIKFQSSQADERYSNTSAFNEIIKFKSHESDRQSLNVIQSKQNYDYHQRQLSASLSSIYSSNKLSGIVGQSLMSPIFQQQQSDMKSVLSYASEENQQFYGKQQSMPMAYGTMNSNQSQHRSTAEQYEIMNEMKKHRGNQYPQVVQAFNVQIPQQQYLNSSFTSSQLGKENDAKYSQKKVNPFSLSNHQQSTTMEGTPHHSQLQNFPDQNQKMVPLHLVETYYTQAMNEKDHQLNQAYNKIAKLSTQVGTQKEKIINAQNETHKVTKENNELRSMLNYLLQSTLKLSKN